VDRDASKDVGDRSERRSPIETWAVSGLTLIATTTTVPRSKGPTVAESIATIREGRVLKGAGEVEAAGA